MIGVTLLCGRVLSAPFCQFCLPIFLLPSGCGGGPERGKEGGEHEGKRGARQGLGRKKAHKHKLFALVNVQMALGQMAGCPGVNRAKKFMCSPQNTGNINFSLWLTGGLSQGCPDFQKVYVFKVYVPFSCLKGGRTFETNPFVDKTWEGVGFHPCPKQEDTAQSYLWLDISPTFFCASFFPFFVLSAPPFPGHFSSPKSLLSGTSDLLFLVEKRGNLQGLDLGTVVDGVAPQEKRKILFFFFSVARKNVSS